MSPLPRPSVSTPPSLYERDFQAWATEQANLLRARKFSALDTENLIEEIESMGKSEKRALESRLEGLLMHLLKWQYQPDRQSHSWRATIEYQRLGVEEILADNPGLKPALPEFVNLAYRKARLAAAAETNLAIAAFPAHCPYTFEEMLDRNFWP